MKRTIVFKTLKDTFLKADIYYEPHHRATILYLHGGALIWGTRTGISTEMIDFYNQIGFNVISIDYRLAPETKLGFIVEDLRDAIQWMLSEGVREYNINPDRIGVVGSSAGGYLALLIGTGICGYRPKVVVSFYGYGDIFGDWYTRPSDFYCMQPLVSVREAHTHIGKHEISEGAWDRFPFYLYCRQQGSWVNEVTGYDPREDQAELMQYNPISRITAEYPPTILLHGTADTDVPFEESMNMNRELVKAGVPTELVLIDKGVHGFDRDFHDPVVQDAFMKVAAFCRKYIEPLT